MIVDSGSVAPFNADDTQEPLTLRHLDKLINVRGRGGGRRLVLNKHSENKSVLCHNEMAMCQNYVKCIIQKKSIYFYLNTGILIRYNKF